MTEVYVSLECRWFIKKPIPGEVQEMFNNVDIETRTDTYWTHKLRKIPPVTSEGTKLREGGFEIKELLKEEIQSDISGRVQKWKKSRTSIPSNIDLDTDWIRVLKNRQLLFYKVSPDQTTGPISYYPKQGCHVELTSFGAPFGDHWTFGIEAFGNDFELQYFLLKVYEKCLEGCQPLKELLKIDNSKSYPEWLANQ